MVGETIAHCMGIGKAAFQFVEDVCRSRQVRALHLEVEQANVKAHALYRRLGFVDQDRHLMTRRTASLEDR